MRTFDGRKSSIYGDRVREMSFGSFWVLFFLVRGIVLAPKVFKKLIEDSIKQK